MSTGKKLVIFGNTKFAAMIGYYIKTETEDEVLCHTVDRKYMGSSAVMPEELLPFEELASLYTPEEVRILPVIGYNRMNDIRKEVFGRIRSMGYELASFIHPTAHVASNSRLGEGNIILEGTLIQPFVTVGSGNVFWSNVNISHHTRIGDFNYFAPSASLSGNVLVDSNCFFGNNCTVKNDAVIAGYTLVGAGAYVAKDTKEYSVIVPVRSQLLENKTSRDMYLG